MITTRSKTWSWMEDVVPFVAMLIVTCLDMGVITIVKAAMNDGMESIVYIVYQDALGILILLPFFIVHIFRNAGRPPLSFYILFRFFLLGVLGICFQILLYVGINYSSPTLGSAISNLIPGNTFLLAVVFRMESIDIRSSSSQAKLLGTITAISGATVFTLYQGPVIFNMIPPSPDSPNQLLVSQPSDWIFGGLILVLAAIVAPICNVLLSATARKYSDQQTIVFFYCLFGTISCIALSPFLEPNPNAWMLQPGTGMIAVGFGAVFSIAFRSTVVTWCLEKKGPVFVAMFSPLSIVIAVIMGVTFIGDSLHLGSAIGAIIVAVGFYTVMWGQAKEKNKLTVLMQDDLHVADEPRSSGQTAPLLPYRNESK